MREPRSGRSQTGAMMAAQVETQALASGECAVDHEQPGAALVAALELALVAAHRLLGELDKAAGRHADAAAHLARALVLAGSEVAPDERALTLLRLARPRESSVRSGRLDATPSPDHHKLSGAHSAASGCAPPACPAGLTRREVEVLRLIAEGKSNRQIAAALYLSPRTAERHVANIYLKIGAHSKAEAAAYALHQGLA